MPGCLPGCLDVYLDAWMFTWMPGCLPGCLDVYLDAWMFTWMFTWMPGCLPGCLDVNQQSDVWFQILRWRNWMRTADLFVTCQPLEDYCNGWSMRWTSPVWKGKSSEPNLCDFGFNMLIFQGVTWFIFGRRCFAAMVVSCLFNLELCWWSNDVFETGTSSVGG